MNDELTLLRFQENYLKLRDTEKSRFSKICNRLLNETFLIKSKEKDRDDYFFALANLPLINDFFITIDYEVLCDDSKGIIHIRTLENRNRIRLSKLETIIALIVRIQYYKRSKIISETDKIIMSIEELQIEVNNTGIYNVQKRINDYEIALRSLRRYKLIDYSKTSIDSETKFEIMPSIMLVINQDDLKTLNDIIKSYVESGEDENNEETNENQTD